MKIQLLEEFIILAEMLNFTKAAQKLCLTQPVLSRHIKELEEYFGDELFLRDTHSVKLSTTGQLVLLESKKVVNQFKTSMTTIHNFTGKSKQTLSVVYLGDAFGSVLIDILTNFNETHAQIDVKYRDCDIDDAINYLKNNEYDVGFIIRPSLSDKFEAFESLELETSRLCAVVNKAHPLANREHVLLTELVKYPIIREDPREFIYSDEYSTSFFQKNNLDYKLYKEYPNLKTCFLNIERHKDTIMLIPSHQLHLIGKNSLGIPVLDDNCFYILELVWNKHNRNPGLLKFIKEFQDSFCRRKES